MGGDMLTLTGSGFLDNSPISTTILIGGTPATSVTVIDDTTLSCIVPVGIAGNMVDVQITNANGAASLASSYRYHEAPLIASVSPPSGTSIGGTSIVINGTGFQVDNAGANSVLIGGVLATNITAFGDTAILCDTPIGIPLTVVDIVVTNANGNALLPSGFAYLPPAPEIAAIAPDMGSPMGGTLVTITGSGFFDFDAGTNTVLIGGQPANSVAVLSDTALTCVTPAGASRQQATIVITNANGTGLLGSAFTYFDPPSLLTLTPLEGSKMGSTEVAITGQGFVANSAGVNTVTFGGVPANNIVAVDDTTITCLTPAGSSGISVDVVVSNTNGMATLSAAYKYFDTPTIVGATPSNAKAAGGDLVTISGAGFLVNSAGFNTVRFGGIIATNVTVVDDTLLTCETPAGLGGSQVDIQVTNDNGYGGEDPGLPLQRAADAHGTLALQCEFRGRYADPRDGFRIPRRRTRHQPGGLRWRSGTERLRDRRCHSHLQCSGRRAGHRGLGSANQRQRSDFPALGLPVQRGPDPHGCLSDQRQLARRRHGAP